MCVLGGENAEIPPWAPTESRQRTRDAAATATSGDIADENPDPAQLHARHERQPLNIGAVGAGGQNPWVGDVHLAAG